MNRRFGVETKVVRYRFWCDAKHVRPPLRDPDCARLLLAGWLLDGRPPVPVADVWRRDAAIADETTLPPGRDEQTAEEHGQTVLALVDSGGASAPPRLAELLPAWALTCVPDGVDRRELIAWLQRRPHASSN